MAAKMFMFIFILLFSIYVGYVDYIKTKYPEIPESIKNDKVLKEEVEEALRKAIGEYKEQFQAR